MVISGEKSSTTNRKKKETTDNNTPAGTSTKSDNNKVELLDDDEQETIVYEMNEYRIKQENDIYQIFHFACIVAALLSLFGTLYIQYYWTIIIKSNNNRNSLIILLFRWFHTICSIALHIITPSICKPQHTPTTTTTLSITSTNSLLPVLIGLNIILATSAVLIITAQPVTPSFDDETENDNITNDIHLHQIVAIGNILTILFSYYIKWDNESSNKAFNDLQSSKYHYKSL